VLPTDTIYGLVGCANSAQAVANIYEAKGRNEDKPLIILIRDVAQMGMFGVKLSSDLLQQLPTPWPTKTTIVVPLDDISDEQLYLHRNWTSLAFRLVTGRLAKLIERTGPLVAPSANPQGQEPAKNIAEAQEYFAKLQTPHKEPLISFYVDGGEMLSSPSSILKLESTGLTVIRP
jgi:L-threonylcarbamoyladenylate synthase